MSGEPVSLKELEKFLRSKGTGEILAELSEEPKTYSELEDVVEISTSTLSKRLRDGAGLGIIEEEIQYQKTLDGEVNKTKDYRITPEYQKLRDTISDSELLKNIRKRRTLDEKINEKYEEIIKTEFGF
jgi:DNA-binding HxlR family transcriptional regulator